MARPFDRRVVDAVLHHETFKRRTLEDGLARDPVIPPDNVAIGIESSAHAVGIGGPIVAAGNVVLARPLQLYRAGAVGDGEGERELHQVIGVRCRPPAKEPTRIERVDLNPFLRKP